MPPTHEEAERRFRELLETGGIAPPDEVVHREGEIVFLWSSSKTAVVLDLASDPAPAGPAGWPRP